jgi:hypothetical protein
LAKSLTTTVALRPEYQSLAFSVCASAIRSGGEPKRRNRSISFAVPHSANNVDGVLAEIRPGFGALHNLRNKLMARLPMRALERRAQMGNDLSVPSYGDILPTSAWRTSLESWSFASAME